MLAHARPPGESITMTDQYGVIGHPIAHSKSPLLHRWFAEQTSQDMSYAAFDIEPRVLATSLARLVARGIRGLNVTVPHKQAVVPLTASLTERARLAGAVNTLSVGPDGSLEGDNTDGAGLVADLRDHLQLAVDGARLLILGAGGAARGIVPALLGLRPAGLLIANRTVERALELARAFAALGPVSACGFDELADDDFDLVINATSAGLHGGLPPFPGSIIGPDTVCYDLSYASSDTPFVRWARAHEAREAYDGLGMLIEQAAESFFRWRGVRPETGPVRARLAAALTDRTARRTGAPAD